MADYTTTAYVKARLVTTLTTDDDRIGRLITDASRAVDTWCNKPPSAFVGQAQTRVFDVPRNLQTSIPFLRDAQLIQSQRTGNWPSVTVAVVDIDPLLSCTEVNADLNLDGTFETTFTYLTDYDLWPTNAPQDLEPWRRLRMLPTTTNQLPTGLRVLQIVGTWGESLSVPEPIRQATELTVIRWYKRPQDALGNVDKGMRQWNPDEDVQAILRQGGYIRPWVIV